nr:immunoglobulin light chain junction region [Macaca mulatta]MOX89665.1 immunoglobulin light chain junction region [Macaca mulatta]
CQQYSLTPFTF